MKNQDEIIKLPTDSENQQSNVPVVRLEKITKNRLNESSNKLRNRIAPAIKVVEAEPVMEQSESEVSDEKTYKAYEGRSQEFGIDAILSTETLDPDALENNWTGKRGSLPLGWNLVLVAIAVSVVGFLIWQFTHSAKMEREESKVIVVDQMESEREEKEDRALIISLEKRVREYLAATDLEKKASLCRHTPTTLERMKMHYGQTPLTAIPCEALTNLMPLNLTGITMWKVVARVNDKKAEHLLVEQTSDNQLLIDWGSHVNYQPMKWEDYIAEKPSTPMTFRVKIEPEARFLNEFQDEERWVCYRLTVKGSEKSLYGYAPRNSEIHQYLQTIEGESGRTIMLRLTASKSIKAPSTVTIDKIISLQPYRLDAPHSLVD